ncbi:MAG: SPOR domain-containing protein, partial [Cytophagales bacterium]|nr:SPOR domain-containing protein [Rhizobacter sp.]
AAILAGKPPVEGPVSTKQSGDALNYFVQAGAFGRPEDAEAQRAKLAISGWAAKVTEREQSGRTVYRVRLGPFEKKEEATQIKEKLENAGVESALVQVQK